MPEPRNDPADKSVKEHLAYISLGSNLGDKRKYLKQARDEINKLPGVRITASSKLYNTEPQDMKDQNWFCNQVVALSCARAITPEGLLDSLLYIEKSLGRKRTAAGSAADSGVAKELPEKGPRVIDLDLLLFDKELRDNEELRLPHPRMARRAFVLVPLLQIAPELCLPDAQGAEQSLESLLKILPYSLEGDKIIQP